MVSSVLRIPSVWGTLNHAVGDTLSNVVGELSLVLSLVLQLDVVGILVGVGTLRQKAAYSCRIIALNWCVCCTL